MYKINYMNQSNSQKGIAPIIVAIVLAVILAGAGGVYYFKQQQVKQVSKTNVANEIANWKTYTNTQYGFEIKYPKNCLPSVTDISEGTMVFGPILIRPEKVGNLALKDYVDKYIKDWESFPSTSSPWSYNLVSSRKEITLDRENAEKISWNFSEPGHYPSDPVDIFTEKDNLIYRISYDVAYPLDCFLYENQDPEELANQILSTFKFTK